MTNRFISSFVLISMTVFSNLNSQAIVYSDRGRIHKEINNKYPFWVLLCYCHEDLLLFYLHVHFHHSLLPLLCNLAVLVYCQNLFPITSWLCIDLCLYTPCFLFPLVALNPALLSSSAVLEYDHGSSVLSMMRVPVILYWETNLAMLTGLTVLTLYPQSRCETNLNNLLQM